MSKLRDSQIPVGPARTRWGRWCKLSSARNCAWFLSTCCRQGPCACTPRAFATPPCIPPILCQLLSPVTASIVSMSMHCACQNAQAARACRTRSINRRHRFRFFGWRLRATHVNLVLKMDMNEYSTGCDEERGSRSSLCLPP